MTLHTYEIRFRTDDVAKAKAIFERINQFEEEIQEWLSTEQDQEEQPERLQTYVPHYPSGR